MSETALGPPSRLGRGAATAARSSDRVAVLVGNLSRVP